MKKLSIEFLGVFFLTLVVCLCDLDVQLSPKAPFAIGGIIGVFTLISFSTSGAHLNPLISLGSWTRGWMSFSDFVSYTTTHFFAAVCSVLLVSLFVPHDSPSHPGVSVSTVFLAEFIFVFLYVFAYLRILEEKNGAAATARSLAMSQGLVAMIARLVTPKVSGAVLNPAVLFALLLTQAIPESYSIAYFVSQVLAAMAAGFLCLCLADNNELSTPKVE